MTKPQIYILVQGGIVQEVRATRGLQCEITVFDMDNRDIKVEENETRAAVEKRLFGLTWEDAFEHSNKVWE